MAGQGLARSERLRGRERLNELFDRGAVGKTRLVLVRALPNDLPLTRVAPLAGRAAGGPAARNRLRRRLRSAFRLRKETLPRGLDLAVLPRRGARDAEFPRLVRDLETAVRRAREALERTVSPEV